jgi:hypothetical protein
VPSTASDATLLVPRAALPGGPPLTLSVIVGLILVSALMLAGGYWLGRMGDQDEPGTPE